MANAAYTDQATTAEAQLYLVALFLKGRELDLPEEDRPNRTTIDYDIDEGEITITVKLPLIFSITGGDTAQIKAGAYIG